MARARTDSAAGTYLASWRGSVTNPAKYRPLDVCNSPCTSNGLSTLYRRDLQYLYSGSSSLRHLVPEQMHCFPLGLCSMYSGSAIQSFTSRSRCRLLLAWGNTTTRTHRHCPSIHPQRTRSVAIKKSARSPGPSAPYVRSIPGRMGTGAAHAQTGRRAHTAVRVCRRPMHTI